VGYGLPLVDPPATRGGVRTPEQEVADILAVEVDPVVVRRVLGEVPFWFHTFALNRGAGIYTPGVAVDHRYRLPFVPASFAVLRVLDVGTFDGFYTFVAEARGARRVVAVNSEQYVAIGRPHTTSLTLSGSRFERRNSGPVEPADSLRGDGQTGNHAGRSKGVIYGTRDGGTRARNATLAGATNPKRVSRFHAHGV
jgi:hypothetical protein